MAIKVTAGTLLAAPSIKEAVINKSTSGDSTIVAAVTSKSIRVVALHFIAAGQVQVTWKSNSTALTGAQSFAGNSGINLTGGGVPVLSTAAGEALVLNLSSAIQVSGRLSYIEE